MRSPDQFKERLTAAVGVYTTDPDLPLRQHGYQSPLRDERLAAWLGASLGILFSTCFVTGLFSHLHQHPLSWLPPPVCSHWSRSARPCQRSAGWRC